MALSLPTNPDLTRFRRDARRLQRSVRAGDADAVALARRHHPEGLPADGATGLQEAFAAYPLHEAQLVVARSYGFASWPRLRAYLRTAAPLRRDPTATPVGDDDVSRFLALACLTYSELDDPARWLDATRLARSLPGLATGSVHAAATLGDADALRQHLAADPGAADREGGPWTWTPLMYVAYSRVPQRDPVGTARALLDAGANPDAGYLWLGLPTPFTVLTGCFGEGEQGPGRQPRHPAGERLAALLLDAGADPNDGQTLYNRMFGRDDSHLRLLLDHGLGRGEGGAWHERLDDALESPAEMVTRQVDWARDHGLTERLALLAEHGFTTDTGGSSPWRRRRPAHPLDLVGTPGAVAEAAARGLDLDALVDGRTLLHQAAWIGDVPMVQALLAAGASPDVLDAEHGTTPLEWAQWAHAAATADVLRGRTGAG